MAHPRQDNPFLLMKDDREIFLEELTLGEKGPLTRGYMLITL